MEINVRDSSKIVEVWLTKAERQDEVLREKLKPLYHKYKDQNYLVAVFQSGDEGLYDLTHDLLRYNRRRTAQREVEQEKGMALRGAT